MHHCFWVIARRVSSPGRLCPQWQQLLPGPRLVFRSATPPCPFAAVALDPCTTLQTINRTTMCALPMYNPPGVKIKEPEGYQQKGKKRGAPRQGVDERASSRCLQGCHCSATCARCVRRAWGHAGMLPLVDTAPPPSSSRHHRRQQLNRRQQQQQCQQSWRQQRRRWGCWRRSAVRWSAPACQAAEERWRRVAGLCGCWHTSHHRLLWQRA